MLDFISSKKFSDSSFNIQCRQPAMRPSAAQLLQHERLEFIFNVSETEKMYAPYFSSFEVLFPSTMIGFPSSKDIGPH
jgi:hypothetical protein